MKTVRIIVFSIFLSCILFLASCKKESLVINSFSEPALYVRGNFGNDSLDFTAGKNLISASPYNIEVDTFRFFNFQFECKDNWGIPCFEIRFNNCNSPFSDITSDLENTIKVGSYLYTEYGYPSVNPYQFSRITITYLDSYGNVYSSRNSYHDLGSFTIYKTEKYLSRDNKKYLKAFINFDCILINNKKEDLVEFKYGQAVIAFEYL